MFDFLHYDFMQRALIAALLIGMLAPLLGVFIVARRASMLSDTLAHIALMGVGIGMFFHGAPLIMAVFITSIMSLLIEKIARSGKMGTEAVQAIFLSGGLSIALIFVSFSKSSINFESFLFGSIVTVTLSDIYILLILGILILITLYVYWWKFLSFSLHEEYAQSLGLRVNILSALLAVITGVTVSLSLRIIGGLLIGALMVIPVLTAMQFSKSFYSTAIFSVVIGIINSVFGLFLAYYLDLPSGATIALFSVACFFFSFILKITRK